MDHAITIGDILKWCLIAGGVVGAICLIFYIVFVVLNPFSSGH